VLKLCFTLQVVDDQSIPLKSLNEIKSVLVSALASHGRLSEAFVIYEEVKKAGHNLEPKAVISLIVRFCVISNLYIFHFQPYTLSPHSLRMRCVIEVESWTGCFFYSWI
jgi:pentatricopeptide repeat protein